MKKRKIKRIVAALGCTVVILVTAVLGVSADIVLEPQPVSARDAYSAFYDYVPSSFRTVAYSNYVLDTQAKYGNVGDLNWQAYIMSALSFCSGEIDVDAHTGFPFAFPITDQTHWRGALDWSIEVNGDLYSNLNSSVYVYFKPSNTIEVHFVDDVVAGPNNKFVLTYRYGDLAVNSSDIVSELVSVQYVSGSLQVGVLVDYPITDITSMSVMVADHYNTGTDGDDGITGFLCNLLFGSSLGRMYSPYSFYYGYADGVLSILDDDAYDRGYQDAVNNIDSGEFGYNILGNVFSAPFLMLDEFELVSWDVGNTFISISLADVLSAIIGISLFIWLLKVFAGG